MAKLRELVKFRNELVEKLGSIDLTAEIESKVHLLTVLTNENPLSDYLPHVKVAISEYQHLSAETSAIKNRLADRITDINNEIYNYAKREYCGEFYQQNFVEEGIKKHLSLGNIPNEKIVNRITQYCDWHYPGLMIMPRSKEHVDLMVGCDPLYLSAHYVKTADGSPEELADMLDRYEAREIANLKEMISDYPLVYQRRLRLYNIKDRDFRILPKEQFGFVLCWDNFDYLTFDVIKQYVHEVFRMLRPGGIFLFSYTNCDLESSADRVESWLAGCCFSSWLQDLFAEIGFEVIGFHDQLVDEANKTYISWVEIRKPGELSTIKYHQSMGEIRDVEE